MPLVLQMKPGNEIVRLDEDGTGFVVPAGVQKAFEARWVSSARSVRDQTVPPSMNPIAEEGQRRKFWRVLGWLGGETDAERVY